MTITLAEVLDLADLEKHIDAGYVKATRHPTAPLTIYNYTNRAQFDRVWNDTTRTCRGLIVHDDDTIVARPFRKFFNHGEVDEIPGGPVRVLDKLDGSMGVLYHDGDGWAIATRGSFTSEQPSTPPRSSAPDTPTSSRSPAGRTCSRSSTPRTGSSSTTKASTTSCSST